MRTRHWNQIEVGESFRQVDEPADPAAGLTIERFTRRNSRGFRRPLVALLAPVLDSRLAAGRSPESDGLLAARAERLVSVSTRRRLVQRWEKMVGLAHAAPRPRSPHAPLCRGRIVDAMGDVRVMLNALSTPFPVSARAVAMASRLLSDGTGPLYNRSCAVPLSTALREVTAQLDPSLPLGG